MNFILMNNDYEILGHTIAMHRLQERLHPGSKV
jgi:hypothetical protein